MEQFLVTSWSLKTFLSTLAARLNMLYGTHTSGWTLTFSTMMEVHLKLSRSLATFYSCLITHLSYNNNLIIIQKKKYDD